MFKTVSLKFGKNYIVFRQHKCTHTKKKLTVLNMGSSSVETNSKNPLIAPSINVLINDFEMEFISSWILDAANYVIDSQNMQTN